MITPDAEFETCPGLCGHPPMPGRFCCQECWADLPSLIRQRLRALERWNFGSTNPSRHVNDALHWWDRQHAHRT